MIVITDSSDSVMTMMDDLGFYNSCRNKIIKKIINLSFRCTDTFSAAGIKHGRIGNQKSFRNIYLQTFHFFHFFSFHFMLMLIICLDR